jgi:alpha-tubulin suppressor-like RCC1 family protein
MPGINLSALKFTWKGQWQTATLYKKNDIVQFNNAAYLCLNDIPDEWQIASNNTWSSTSMGSPEIAFRDKRPDTDVQYWRIVVRGNTFKRGWMPHRVYQYGDIVRYGGDLYMYQGVTGQGAYATANINGQGQVTSITVNAGGTGYGVGTTVRLGNDGHGGDGAQAYPVITPTSKLNVTAATKTNPVRITTAVQHGLSNGQAVTFPDINGMTQLVGTDFYVSVVNATQVDLYYDSARTSPVDGTGYSTFIASLTSGFMNVSAYISQIVVSHPGSGYTVAPTVAINPPTIRNTWPEDTTYWVRVFTNPNQDTRRLYAVATPNMQPLGWTRNNGDYTNPVVYQTNSIGFIGADGVCYSQGGQGNTNSQNTAGRGVHTWSNSWQPACFTFVDWLRSYDNQTSLNLTGLTSGFLPTPDGQAPRCVQWIRSYAQSLFLMNNGEVYSSGYNSATGPAGNSGTSQVSYTTRVTSNATTGWLSETLPRSFNQTKIIKVDMPNIGRADSADVSCYALGSDGSVWAWGSNSYGQLGLGQQPPATTGSITGNVILPTRIPAIFFDNKKIVDFMCFGNNVTSVLAIDEDGDLWGWGADYYGELGLGGYPTTNNYRLIPTRIPFDFKRYGGIKKMSYSHYSTTNYRFAMILTNDGSLFGAGIFHRAIAPLIRSTSNANAFDTYNRWTKFITVNANIKAVENFWIIGDARATNIFIRERDTGLTFAAGDNSQRTTQPDANSAYNWYNSGGDTNLWNLIKGPRNIVHVTNNEGQESTTAAPFGYLTVMLLEENGRAWGQGYNQAGSLSLGWNGVNNDPINQNPETGAYYMYQPIKVPSGARISTFMGQGVPGSDLSLFVTDDGQALIAGYDGPSSANIQGMTQYSYYDQVISTQSQVFNRYTMHTLIGD